MHQYLIGFFISIYFTYSQSSSNIVFSEEFDGSELNKDIWNFELGDGCPNLCGWGNNEPQIYTDSNHTLENGFLRITAKHENNQYTSTRITTKNKFEFKYGRIEARIKLPKGTGVWPAFWMLGSNIDEVGWPKCGEIDIMEYVGREPDHVFSALHTQSSHGDNVTNIKKTKIETIEEGFHLFEADWNSDRIVFSVDGEELYTYKPQEKNVDVWPYDQSFYIILNIAVGGNFGGPQIDNTIFPQEYVIDYIRVYKN